jgi:para-aminobenzoate synthetase component 1
MEWETEQVIEKMNRWGREKRPFLFLFDFEMENPVAIPLEEVNPDEILFDINGQNNIPLENKPGESGEALHFVARPVPREKYCKAFSLVQQHIRRGDSFLLNLTQPNTISCNLGLKEIFFHSRAKYKVWYHNRFVCFSPETFVQVQNGIIRSFPMKGTIDARLKNAREILLSSKKELAEHFTIVDLIRNDLNRVAHEVEVVRFRYIDKIVTHKNEILQMSSEIAGKLRPEFAEAPGDMLMQMLPAGSISGAPKKKTVEIIRQVEGYKRGFYTGVTGVFDGKNLDSAVMIRFIEQTGKGLTYKSGGGITALSRCDNEYRELIEKIYVPSA